MTRRQDLQVRQGVTFVHSYIHRDAAGNPVDLTGYAARMRVAADYASLGEAYLTTDSNASGGSLEITPASGQIDIKFTAVESAALAGNLSELVIFDPSAVKAKNDRFVHFIYDLELVAPEGSVERVLEGDFIVQREVTGWL